MLDKVKCNLCGSGENSILAHTSISPFGTISDLVKCKQCGLVYFSPRHPMSEELEFYRSKYQEAYGEKFWYESRIDFFRTALEGIESLCPSKGRLLDAGCGMGFFLKEARDAGWKQVLGVDVSHLAVDYASKKLGLEVLKGDLRDQNVQENYFDAITAWNVIDQLQDPVGMLREMHRVPKEGGLIALRVSNLSFHILVYRLTNLLRTAFRRRITFPARSCFHIYAFSPSTMRLPLQRTGYVNIKIYNSPVEGGGTARNRLGRAARQLVFGLSEGMFYLTLEKLVLSPSLLVFARKPRKS